MRAIAYACASADDPEGGIDAQIETTRLAIEDRGWELAEEAIDSSDAANAHPSRRRGLRRALRALDDGVADVLVVTRLEHVTTSSQAWKQIVERSYRHGWTLLAAAEGMDLRTDSDEMLAAVTRTQRDLKSTRAKQGARAARARGTRLGRPVEHTPEVRRLVLEARDDGATLQQIADRLTREGHKTPGGGRWHRSTVQKLLHRARLDAERDDALALQAPMYSSAATSESPVADSTEDSTPEERIKVFSAQAHALEKEALDLAKEALIDHWEKADIEHLSALMHRVRDTLALAASPRPSPILPDSVERSVHRRGVTAMADEVTVAHGPRFASRRPTPAEDAEDLPARMLGSDHLPAARRELVRVLLLVGREDVAALVSKQTLDKTSVRALLQRTAVDLMQEGRLPEMNVLVSAMLAEIESNLGLERESRF